MPEDNDFIEEEAGSDSSAMLDIIREKDKIISTLKESAAQNDKINENQISLLSEDNEKKLKRINELMAKVRKLEKEVQARDEKLSLNTERSSTHGFRLEQLKLAVDEYKDNISHSVGEIRDMVTKELHERDERGEQILDRMRSNQDKLEGKLSEVEQYYKNMIHGISEKQVKSRLFIRKALVDLQEALSQLDLNANQPILDSRKMSEFQDLLSQSEDLANEYRSRSHDASTVIHNIENVNIQLASTPKLDRLFQEQLGNQDSEGEGGEGGGGAGGEGGGGDGGGGDGAGGDGAGGGGAGGGGKGGGGKGGGGADGLDDLTEFLEEAWSNAAGGAESASPKPPQQPPSPPSSQMTAKQQTEGQTPGSAAMQPPPMMGGGHPPPSSPFTHGAGQMPPYPQAGMPGYGGAPVMTIAMDQKEEQKFKTEEDLILRESPNLAPYNWDMLPIASPLLHFRHMLNSAKGAETQRNYLKAIGIYKAVMEQKTIQENDLAKNILKDQLEALDRLARSQISLNPKRRDIERYFHQDLDN
ncbi:MAG: hypothetical protein LBC99_00620 [Spirochaetota bacterium]|jgi:hypothetical protein|nr:hypothetical protein [Spirochaetota bacterium]